jgi:hypothetical protein
MCAVEIACSFALMLLGELHHALRVVLSLPAGVACDGAVQLGHLQHCIDATGQVTSFAT